MKSAITISLTPEARGGPFVYWDDLDAACARAAQLGFDAVEIFAPSPAAIPIDRVRKLLEHHSLKLAAVGTGAGWVVHRLTLTNPDAAIRQKAIDFIRSIIDAGGPLGAPTIVGSMQGRWGEGAARETAFKYLSDAFNQLGEHARPYSVPVIYEPLNRYETNMVNTMADGIGFLRSLQSKNVTLLADLFHMNIEEVDLAASIRQTGASIGHVHLADSNRRPAGNGHTDFASIAAALRDVGYRGYISAEYLPWPDSDKAAAQTIDMFRRHFSTT